MQVPVRNLAVHYAKFKNEIDHQGIILCKAWMHTEKSMDSSESETALKESILHFTKLTLKLVSKSQVCQDGHFHGIQSSAGEGSAYFSFP